MTALLFVFTAIAGALLLPAGLRLGLAARLGLGFGFAVCAVSLQMLVYDLLGLGWPAVTLLPPWLLAAGLQAYRRRDEILAWRPAAPRLFAAAPLLLLAVPLFLWLPYERLMPLTSQSWDAWAIWLLKAKAFSLDGGIAGFFQRVGEFETQPGYPLLTPLYSTFLYELLGKVDDRAAKLLSPAFLFAMWALFYGVVRRVASAWAAASLTAMLGLLPMVNLVAFELAGYADTALSFYLVASAAFLYVWLREQRLTDLALSSIAATAAAWTKNEGQLFLAAVTLVAAAVLVARRRFGMEWVWLVAPPALALGAWTWVRSSYGIEAAGFTPLINFRADLFGIALNNMLAKAFSPGSFSLAFVLLAAGCGLALWLRPHPAFWLLPGLVAWQWTGALLAYATGRNEIHWWLETSANRILAQIAPLALLAMAPLMERLEARFPAPSAPRPQSRPAPPSRRKPPARRKKGGRQ